MPGKSQRQRGSREGGEFFSLLSWLFEAYLKLATVNAMTGHGLASRATEEKSPRWLQTSQYRLQGPDRLA